MATGVAATIAVFSIAFLAIVACLAWRALSLDIRLREERRRSRALAEAVRTVAEAASDGEAATQAALFQAMGRLIPCRLFLYFRADGDFLRCVDGWGAAARAWRGVRLQRDGVENVVTLAARTGRTQVLSGPGGLRPLVPEEPRSLALAIRYRDRISGVLYAGGLARVPEMESVELVAALCAAGAGALEAAARVEHHVSEATTDGLTGLLTPRAFRLRLARDLAAVHRHGSFQARQRSLRPRCRRCALAFDGADPARVLRRRACRDRAQR